MRRDQAADLGQDAFGLVVSLFITLYLAFFLIRDGDGLDRLGGEVALDLSLSRVRVERGGEIAVLEHRERDGALSTLRSALLHVGRDTGEACRAHDAVHWHFPGPASGRRSHWNSQVPVH